MTKRDKLINVGLVLIIFATLGMMYILLKPDMSVKAGVLVKAVEKPLIETICVKEDSCTPDWTNGAWWMIPDGTDIPDCEDVNGQTPCYTYDEDEWRLVTSYDPYAYKLLK